MRMKQTHLYLLAFALVAASVITLAVRTLSLDFQAREASRLAGKTQGLLHTLGGLTREAVSQQELGPLRTAAARFLGDPEIAGLRVTDAQGFPLVNHPPADPAGLESHSGRVSGGGDGPSARVETWVSPAPAEQRVRAFTRRAASGGLLVGLGMLLPLSWVFSSIGLALRQAREALDPAAEGDPSRRVGGRARGEFRDLFDGINKSLQAFQLTRAQADAWNRQLKLSEHRAGEQAALAQSNQALLLASERALKALFDQSPYWMGLIKPDGAIQGLNRGILEALGSPADGFTGREFWHLPLFESEALRGWVHGDFLSARSGGSPSRTLDLSARSGRPHFVECTLKAIPDDKGAPWRILFLAHEVTAQVLAEKGIVERDAQVQQVQKMDAIGQLAGGIAHDFNNLLSSILGFGQMVREQLPPDSPALKDMDEVIESGERAKKLTMKLLNLSRKRPATAEPTNLNQLIRSADKLIRLTIHENVEYITQLDDSIGFVEVDPVSTEQILVNLAVNARDAMPRSGRFYVKTRRAEPDEAFLKRHELPPGAYVELSVRDTGCGMEPAILEHIFEPFFTTKEPGQGTGLGLSTVFNIVRQYKGAITVDSRPGGGTEFKIYFPEMSHYEPPTAASAAVRKEPPRGTETILLVEDEEGLRRLGGKIISSLGYKVFTAEHGQAGLDLFREHLGDIDLVLSDVVMPVMSGPDMIRRMRGARRDLKFLFVSGFTRDKLAQQGISHLEGAVIRKPYDKMTLAQRIREELDKTPHGGRTGVPADGTLA